MSLIDESYVARGIVALGFSLLALGVCATQLFKRVPMVTLTSSGIKVYGEGYYEWGQVGEVYAYAVPGFNDSFVKVHIAMNVTLTPPNSGEPLQSKVVLPPFLNIGQRSLIKLIEEYRDQAAS